MRHDHRAPASCGIDRHIDVCLGGKSKTTGDRKDFLFSGTSGISFNRGHAASVYHWKALILACVFSTALTAANLHITGAVQSRKTSEINLGHLPKQYRAADWTITSDSPAPLKVSLARIRQAIQAGPGITILSRISSIDVVQDAQGSNPINTVARVGSGIVGAAAAAQALKVIPAAGGWGSSVILGAEVFTLALQYVFPTLRSHAVQSITEMLPENINLDPMGTASGMVIIELGKKVPDPPPLDVIISIGEK